MAHSTDQTVLMDWSPTQAPVILESSPKRKFDEIVDITTPFSREPTPDRQRQELPYGNSPLSWRNDQSWHDGPLDGSDSRLETLETTKAYGTAAAMWACAITCFVVMTTIRVLRVPLGYATSYATTSIKRRLISPLRNAGADDRPTTPRKRKYRNIYLTPRQRYEQRSARSRKLRDMPGRFPDTPLTEYCHKKPSRHQEAPLVTPQVVDMPDMSDLPGTFNESPARVPPASESLLQLMSPERLLELRRSRPIVRPYDHREDRSTNTSAIRNDQPRPDTTKTSIVATAIGTTAARGPTAANATAAKATILRKKRSMMSWPFGSRIRKSVNFHESPVTGRPITRTKRFVKGETITYPSPNTTIDESSIVSSHSLRTAQRFEDLINAQLQSTSGHHSTSTPNTNITEGANNCAYEQHDSPGPVSHSPQSIEQGRSEQPQPKSPEESEPVNATVPEQGSTQQPEPKSIEESEPVNAAVPEQTTPAKSKRQSSKKPEPKFAKEQEPESSKKSSPRNLFDVLRNKRRPYQRRSGQKSAKESIDAILKAASEDHDSSVASLDVPLADLNLDPRRLSAREQKLAEQAAIEKAAREAEEKARAEKEAAELEAQIAREREKEIKRLGLRQFTKQPIIAPLSAEQEEKVELAFTKGQKVTTMNNIELTTRDWRTVVPTDAWLNDNIINAYLDYVVQMAHDRVGLKRNEAPKMHAFNNNFYNNLAKSGYTGVARWARRAKIAGKALLSLEYIFVPVNASNNHWTLAVISPVRRTIEYFDSLHMSGRKSTVFSHLKEWLLGELGDAYVANEWTVRDEPGPHQGNMSDCGVHTVTTAKLIALGIDPMAAPARLMPLQRRRIVAELLNSGFHGEFEVDFEFA